MRKLLVVLIFIFCGILTNAQSYPFQKKWEEVDKQIDEGSLTSTLPLIEEIYQAAQKNDAVDDRIKALILKSNIAMITTDNEDIALEVRDQFVDEINNSSGVTKSVLQSLLAELYWNYLRENSYRLNQRSQVNLNQSTDFRTWATVDFLQVTDSLLQVSLTDKKALYNTNLNHLELLLDGDDSFRYLQPTAYDILTKRALNLYSSYYFDNEEIAHLGKDDKVEQIYADAIRLHKDDKDKSALIQYEISHIIETNDEEESQNKALHQLYEKYATEPWSTNILATIANNLIQTKPVEAVKLCNLAIKTFPDSFGAKRCAQIKEQIEFPYVHLQTEGTFFANQYNPLVITHKNVDVLYYRVYKLNPNQFANNLNGFEFDYQTNTIKTVGEIVQEDIIQLKQFKDYQAHTTHIPFPPLNEGNYVILVSTQKNFEGKMDVELLQTAIVSSSMDLTSRNNEYQLLDKKTGLPVTNKTIQLYAKYRNKPLVKESSFKTDAMGRFQYTTSSDYRKKYFMKLIDDSTLFLLNAPYNQYNKDEEEKYITKVFTDRAIYRPGQTVYFKAVLYTSKGKERKIAPHEEVEFQLEDANYTDISSLDLVSNEFGSVHGEFVLPTSGITGAYSLYNDWADNGSYSIRVEEYKRPKFKVELDTLKGTYTLNNNVKVKGNARSFSGANITDADVTFRVERETYNPYDWWWRGNETNAVEIAYGDIITDKDGSFEFDFIALPNKKDEHGKRAYVYTIYTEVTDVSGETRTAERSVRIGDIPITIDIITENKMSVDDFKQLKIQTQNLNGVSTAAEGTLTIARLNKLDRVLREKQTKVDYEYLDKPSFIEKLPYIAYNNEHLLAERSSKDIVLSQDWSTANSDIVHWNKTFKAGHYAIRATSIYGNDTIQQQQIIEVFDPKNNEVQNVFFDAQIEKQILLPGDIAKINFLSDAKDAHVIVEVEENGKIVKTEILSLDNSATFSFPITEEHRGGVNVLYYFNKYNTSIANYIHLDVPYENKILDIEVASMRNKLEPGVEETWELTVKDRTGDRFMAEVLAGMYDKSLDDFVGNNYAFHLYSNNYPVHSNWFTNNSTNFHQVFYRHSPHISGIQLERFFLFGLSLNEQRARMYKKYDSANREERVSDAAAIELSGEVMGIALNETVSLSVAEEPPKNPETEASLEQPVRKNLQETAFFFPNLKTDKEGNVRFSFTSPEALTAWNFQAVAHTKDLKTGVFQTNVVTQKELMVVPNAPRFLRENDQLNFTTKIINLSDKNLSGDVQLILLDAFTMQPIGNKFKLSQATQKFNVEEGGNIAVSWSLNVPKIDEVKSVIYRVIAKSGAYSDGEENALPILTNRTLVTETMPIHIRENQQKTFTLDKLKNSSSNSRENFKLTMEMTTQPIWYAVMALPYLREYPYECSEQVFARLYGNLISQDIINSNHKIKAVFDDWNTRGELISPLEKNEELKNILLEESPWLRQAQSESEQMKRISVLFDLNKMRNELQTTYLKLAQKQSSNGGFPWFEGGYENEMITTHIVAGFGHLDKMGIDLSDYKVDEVQNIPLSAITFIDSKMLDRWNKYNSNKQHYKLSGFDGLYWLYARSFYLDKKPLSPELVKAKDYFLAEMQKGQFKQNLYTQGLLAIALHRFGKTAEAQKLVHAIKERAVISDEMGMYWKENTSGYRWNEAPVETQALIIEAFDEIVPHDIQSVEDMKVWLLKNKQTNRWSSTKATTEAVYALMNTGKDWINADEGVTVTIGNEVWLSPTHQPDASVQSGSGYVKTSWNGAEIKPELATVKVDKSSPGVAWGAMYWQYFEDLDKISSTNTAVRFNKQLFIERSTPQGRQLFEISENDPIKIGDLVKVRLEIQTDRAMEFVHIKDMRASGFEPVNVLSQYKWQDNLGYYESTRDAATNFFVDYMPKGVYVFEYALRANNSGVFSNGITQMQNMYAPEFSAHSEGIEIKIE